MSTKASSAKKSEIMVVGHNRENLRKPLFENLKIIRGWNSRELFEGIEELAQSIETTGLQEPLQGYFDGKQYCIVDGERRYRALKLLHERGVKPQIDFLVEPQQFNTATRLIKMILANDGKPLTVLELANAVARLFDSGLSDKEIGAALGKAPGYIGKLMLLNASPVEFKELVKNKTISATLAIEVATQKGVKDFMVRYKAGEFDKPENNSEQLEIENPSETNITEEPGSKAAKKASGKNRQTATITKKDLKKKTADNVKFFKNFGNTVNEVKFEGKEVALKEVFTFINKMLANELAIDEIFTFFNQK